MHQALLLHTHTHTHTHTHGTHTHIIIISSTVGVTPPSHQTIVVCLHRCQREWSSPSITVRGGADNQPDLGVYKYVLCRRMRDRAENPTVGVGVVHQALAAPHTTRGGLPFIVCVADGFEEVADERSPLTQ